MQDTVMEAEESEPLLADQLYDAARKARQQELDSTLNTARRMLEYGFLEDAKREEAQARQGISELREGIERAADSVLGDETEALRRARETLEELSNQLAGELSRENPQASGEQSQNGSPNESGEVSEPREGAESSEQQNSAAGSPGSRDQPDEPNPSDREQPGRSPSSGEPSESESQRPGRPSGQQPPSDSPSPGEPNAQTGQPGQSPSTEDQPGEASQPGQQQSSSNAEGQPSQSGQPQTPGGSSQPNSGGSRGGFERAFQTGTGGPNNVAPIGGDDFVEWSDRLRDVEEMLDDPELRAEAARIRDRARGFRVELKRHSKEPSWDLVELQVAKPLAELRDRIAEELLRRTSDESAIPLDRDPVPSRFTEQVRKYYERLGSGQ
jgi:hypothetical protein